MVVTLGQQYNVADDSRPFHVLLCYDTLTRLKELAVKPNLEC